MEPPHRDFRRMAVEEFDTSKLLAHASKQARDRRYDKFPIVDVDSHHYENESLAEILEYMDDPVLRQLALAGSRPNAKNARIMNTMWGIRTWAGASRATGCAISKPRPGPRTSAILRS